jgi:phospholipid/cholesterol/gamma-HCH transport system permease protein
MSAQPIIQLGRGTTRFVLSLGEVAAFTGQILASLPRTPVRVRRILDEIYGIGVLSLSIILLSGLVVGLVLGLQGHTTLVRFGAEQNLGAMVGLVLIRELGPTLTALLITGRAGSAVAAEIGSMVVTEQLDGLRMMSIDPVDYVVKPKVVAMVLSMPLLSALFTVMGILGGWVVGVIFVGGDSGVYLSSLESSVVFREDVLGSLIKALVFGILVGLIATWRGFTASPSAAGVSAATTSTVVSASVFVLVFNYFITALWRF